MTFLNSHHYSNDVEDEYNFLERNAALDLTPSSPPYSPISVQVSVQLLCISYVYIIIVILRYYLKDDDESNAEVQHLLLKSLTHTVIYNNNKCIIILICWFIM